MKTIEEVKEFLKSKDFGCSDACRIVGFLLGKGIVAKGEIINFGEYVRGKKYHICTFDEFYAWFENDEDDILEGLMNFLQDEQDKALEEGNIEKANTLAMYLGFIVDALELEYEEVEEDETKFGDR